MSDDTATFTRDPSSRRRFWESDGPSPRITDIEYVRVEAYAPRVRSAEALREREQGYFARALWPEGKCPDDLDRHLGLTS